MPQPQLLISICAAGAPSLINAGGKVGAGDLLSAERGEVIELDYALPEGDFAAQVERLLEDSQKKLASVGAAAAARARSWTEAANAQKLTQLIEGALASLGQKVTAC